MLIFEILEIVANFLQINYTLHIDLIGILNSYQVNVQSIIYSYKIHYNFQNPKTQVRC